jgi:uncharacterized membrane protein
VAIREIRGLLKGGLIAVLITAYALASHLALTLPRGQEVAAALALGVPAAALNGFLFQLIERRLSRNPAFGGRSALSLLVAGALAALPPAALLWMVWPLVLAHTQALYFIQHVGTNALLAWAFGHTLIAGSTPLVVTFARLVHPVLPPDIEAYAAKVTAAWTLFFLVTCAISVLLYVAAPLEAWSIFAVLLQWPSVAIFFAGEYALRRRLFRQFEHASMKQGFDAYQRHRDPGEPACASKW